MKLQNFKISISSNAAGENIQNLKILCQSLTLLYPGGGGGAKCPHFFWVWLVIFLK